MKFGEFVKKFEKDNNPWGDFAKDASGDKKIAIIKNQKELSDYFKTHYPNACSEARDIAKQIMSAYLQATR